MVETPLHDSLLVLVTELRTDMRTRFASLESKLDTLDMRFVGKELYLSQLEGIRKEMQAAREEDQSKRIRAQFMLTSLIAVVGVVVALIGVFVGG